MNNGYHEIRMVEHPKAKSNGCVYEHILVAEEKLGRFLNEHEVVHHIDETRDNNSQDNLMVMFDQSDHLRMHGPRSKYAVKRLDGSYTVPDSRYKVNKHWVKTWYVPHGVYPNGAKPKIEWPPLDELLKLIEETNYSAAGRKLGVSDNAIRKHLKKHL